MIKITDKELSDFFQDYPLYSKIQLLDSLDPGTHFNIFEFFENKAYKFYCPHEKDYHTFRIQKKWGSQYVIDSDTPYDFYLDKSSKISFSFQLKSTCQSCDFKMDFLLNIFTQKEIQQGDKLPNLYLKKIGQLPAFERNPEKEVLDYLNNEDKENYKKALSNLSMSFGIGAFAYLRRIIENEIKNIVRDLSKLNFEGSENVKKAWKEYEINHQMSNLIDNINPFIPASLKGFGDNPIRLLHQQLSGGIHEYSEEICLEKAKQIDVLLRYVIKKINSEKYELNDVRNAMKSLKN